MGQSAPQTFEGRCELDFRSKVVLSAVLQTFLFVLRSKWGKMLVGPVGFWLQYCEWPLGKNGRAAVFLVWYPALISHPRSAPGWGGTVPERSPGASHDPPWRADLGLEGELLLHVLQD